MQSQRQFSTDLVTHAYTQAWNNSLTKFNKALVIMLSVLKSEMAAWRHSSKILRAKPKKHAITWLQMETLTVNSMLLVFHKVPSLVDTLLSLVKWKVPSETTCPLVAHRWASQTCQAASVENFANWSTWPLVTWFISENSKITLAQLDTSVIHTTWKNTSKILFSSHTLTMKMAQ